MNKLQIILLLIIFIISSSCTFKKKVNKKKSTSSDSTPISPGPTTAPPPSSTPTVSIRPPYPFSAFIDHGVGFLDPPPSSNIIWSTIEAGISHNVLITDSRFDIRVKKVPSPALETVDGDSSTCRFGPYEYTKLIGYIGIRAADQSVYKKMRFETDPDTGYSDILKFGDLADFPYTTQHYVIVVMGPIESDGGCVRSPGHPDVCPTFTIPETECFSMFIELATDYTDSF